MTKPSVWTEMHRVPIRVSSMHIATGRAGDCYACPVALALMEAVGGEWAVSDAMGVIVAQELRTGFQTKLPHPVLRFVSDFDSARTVQPFSFDLDLPLALLPVTLLPGPFNTARKCGF